jgi:hypothetical protein
MTKLNQVDLKSRIKYHFINFPINQIGWNLVSVMFAYFPLIRKLRYLAFAGKTKPEIPSVLSR